MESIPQDLEFEVMDTIMEENNGEETETDSEN
jgi:hypothetical protein